MDGVSASPLAGGVPAGFPKDSLAGTSFHARAAMVGGTYDFDLPKDYGNVKLYAGGQYAKIDPLTGVSPGYQTVGDTLATVTPAAAGHNVTDWGGAGWTSHDGHFGVRAGVYGFEKDSGTARNKGRQESVAVSYSPGGPKGVLSYQLSYSHSEYTGSGNFDVVSANVTASLDKVKVPIDRVLRVFK
jgi:hypothetical protein